VDFAHRVVVFNHRFGLRPVGFYGHPLANGRISKSNRNLGTFIDSRDTGGEGFCRHRPKAGNGRTSGALGALMEFPGTPPELK
jgi:hypothetical protein